MAATKTTTMATRACCASARRPGDPGDDRADRRRQNRAQPPMMSLAIARVRRRRNPVRIKPAGHRHVPRHSTPPGSDVEAGHQAPGPTSQELRLTSNAAGGAWRAAALRGSRTRALGDPGRLRPGRRWQPGAPSPASAAWPRALGGRSSTRLASQGTLPAAQGEQPVHQHGGEPPDQHPAHPERRGGTVIPAGPAGGGGPRDRLRRIGEFGDRDPRARGDFHRVAGLDRAGLPPPGEHRR